MNFLRNIIREEVRKVMAEWKKDYDFRLQDAKSDIREVTDDAIVKLEKILKSQDGEEIIKGCKDELTEVVEYWQSDVQANIDKRLEEVIKKITEEMNAQFENEFLGILARNAMGIPPKLVKEERKEEEYDEQIPPEYGHLC